MIQDSVCSDYDSSSSTFSVPTLWVASHLATSLHPVTKPPPSMSNHHHYSGQLGRTVFHEGLSTLSQGLSTSKRCRRLGEQCKWPRLACSKTLGGCAVVSRNGATLKIFHGSYHERIQYILALRSLCIRPFKIRLVRFLP
jgi:hypothetical protein